MMPKRPKTYEVFNFASLKSAVLFLLCLTNLLLTVPAQQSIKTAVADLPCNIARLAFGRGNYEKALQSVKPCLKSDSENSPMQRAENLLLAAEIEFNLGDDKQAANYTVQAENHYASLDAEKRQKLWLFSVQLKKIRGALEAEASNYESALKLYREGLKIVAAPSVPVQTDGGEPRRLKADLLSGIAFVELKTGFYSDAITNLESALMQLGDSHPDDYIRAGTLNDFGHLLNEQRSHRQAIEYLEKSAQIWQREKDWFNYAMTQQNLAVAYRGIGDYKQAQIYFERVQDLAIKNSFAELEMMSLQGLASLEQVRGEYRKAIEILHKALSQTTASARRAEILWRLSSNQNLAGESASARANASECYEWASGQKIENLRYLCATNLGESFLLNSPTTAEKWLNTAVEVTENLSRRVAGREAEKVYFMQDKSAAYHGLIKLYVKANKPEQALAVSEKLKSRVLREKLQNRRSKILSDDVSSRTFNLPADTAVVSYVLAHQECFVFVLKANEPPKVIALPVGEAKLREQIGHYRESILNFSPTFKTESRVLFDSILKAADGEIGKTKHLIIVPDGALWELPFQALITPSGKYLVEEREVSYAPSLGVLNAPKPDTASTITRKNFVAFANSTRKDSVALPEAEREANGIGKLYAPSSIFVKTAATEKRVKTEAAQAKVLHLAVHGEINQADPFASALLFTPETGDDGRLTVAEILRMPLPDSLVVLSSCDTSNGQVLSGEGLLSLSWAFLASGGRVVVAAQWAVEEKATADLMLNFHRALKGNAEESASALRAAQLEALKRAAPLNHPFYWSAFVAVEGPQR